MKRTLSAFAIFSLVFALGSALLSDSANAVVRVSGYVKKSGTYVAPSYRTSPDTLKFNNFSAKGNINPYTGAKGYVDPYKYTAPKISTPKYTAQTYKAPTFKAPSIKSYSNSFKSYNTRRR